VGGGKVEGLAGVGRRWLSRNLLLSCFGKAKDRRKLKISGRGLGDYLLTPKPRKGDRVQWAKSPRKARSTLLGNTLKSKGTQ